MNTEVSSPPGYPFTKRWIPEQILSDLITWGEVPRSKWCYSSQCRHFHKKTLRLRKDLPMYILLCSSKNHSFLSYCPFPLTVTLLANLLPVVVNTIPAVRSVELNAVVNVQLWGAAHRRSVACSTVCRLSIPTLTFKT